MRPNTRFVCLWSIGHGYTWDLGKQPLNPLELICMCDASHSLLTPHYVGIQMFFNYVCKYLNQGSDWITTCRLHILVVGIYNIVSFSTWNFILWKMNINLITVKISIVCTEIMKRSKKKYKQIKQRYSYNTWK